MALNKVNYVDGQTVITAENLNDIQDAIIALENAPAQGLTEDMKQALLQLARKVAYIDDQGQTYYDDLYDALYPPKTVVLITAVFEQGSTVIYDDTALDELKQYLTVTAKYDDNTTAILADSAYTLSGLLEAGTSTVTVAYNGLTTTFTVNVTARPTLSSISAVYTQSGTVYDTDTLDSLKADLVVTAHYSDSSTQTVPAADYTLSGTLTVGTSTITVAYGGKTATFEVTVSEISYTVVYAPGYFPGMVSDSDQSFIVKANASRMLVAASNGAHPLPDENGEPSQYFPIPIPSGAQIIGVDTGTQTMPPSSPDYLLFYPSILHWDSASNKWFRDTFVSWNRGTTVDVSQYNSGDYYIVFNVGYSSTWDSTSPDTFNMASIDTSAFSYHVSSNLTAFTFVAGYTNGVVNTDQMRLKSNIARMVGVTSTGEHSLLFESGSSSSYYPVAIPSGASELLIVGVDNALSISRQIVYWDSSANQWKRANGGEWIRKRSYNISDYNSGSYAVALNIAVATDMNGVSSTASMAGYDGSTWKVAFA